MPKYPGAPAKLPGSGGLPFANMFHMKSIPTFNKLPEKLRHEVAGILNRSLASTTDLRYQAKDAHWNVKGPEFRSLHKLFDQLAKRCDKYADAFAERLVQLGYTTNGRIQDTVANTELQEYPQDIYHGMEHVELLADRLSIYTNHLIRANARCDELGDAGTADLYVEALRAFDEMLWMIEAHFVAPKEAKAAKLRPA